MFTRIRRRNNVARLLSTLLFASSLVCSVEAAELVDFVTQIKPILERRCVSCHGQEKRQGKLRLDVKEAVIKRGKVIVAGAAVEILLFQRINLDKSHDDIMPPTGDALDDKTIELIRSWIDAGAKWPDGVLLASSVPSSRSPLDAADSPSPLCRTIDALLRQAYQTPVAGSADDAEFLRRVTLDLAGRLPTPKEVVTFLADERPGRRTRLVDRLLDGLDYPRRMADAFSVMLLERRRGNEIPYAEWHRYLRESFAANKPWDVLIREILAAEGIDPITRPAVKFYLDRKNADLLTIDISRLRLGRDIHCAQCHDHPDRHDYTQGEYKGLFAYLSGSHPYTNPRTQQVYFIQNALKGKVEFKSVFSERKAMIGPKLLHRRELAVPRFEKGLEYIPADKASGLPQRLRFQRRKLLAAQLPTPDNPWFKRNAVNRIWFLMMGRGLVHPLDALHEASSASHPELLEQLAEEFYRMNFDIKAFIRQLVLTEAYQRSSLLPEGTDDVPPESYAVFNIRPLSPEQLAWTTLQATGNLDAMLRRAKNKTAGGDANDGGLEQALERFREAYGAAPGEAEIDYLPSVVGAFFMRNDPMVLGWLKPQDNNLMERLLAMAEKNEHQPMVDELYLSMLSRYPDAEEKTEALKYCQGGEESVAVYVWALLTSTEFRMVH